MARATAQDAGAPAATGETIVAPASGFGRGMRALIRLSGPGIGGIISRCFEGSTLGTGKAGSARLNIGVRADGGRRITTPCLVMRYAAPRSFTGEDVLEILIPGNPSLVERVVSELVSIAGVRLARPGEFAARAYLAGKLSIEQAEGLAAAIAAQTDAQLAAAARLLDGSRGRAYRTWADELATLLALVEAGIDFSDQEDVVPIPPDELRRRVGALTELVKASLGATASWERAGELPRFVLVGAPNAGKSTVFNALLGRRRAVVSDVAGTTRDALVEELSLSDELPGRGGVLLIDLPGLDPDAEGQIDQLAQRHALGELARADVAIHCDPTGRFDLAPVGHAKLPDRVIRVQTKADIAGRISESAVPVCALDGWNLPVLRRAIADSAQMVDPDDPAAAVLPRQRRGLIRCLDGLAAAVDAMPAPGAHALERPELVAAGLRSALDEIGEITGDISPDDVLGRVFAVFCIGK